MSLNFCKFGGTVKLKETIKNFIRKYYGKGLPVVRRKLSSGKC